MKYILLPALICLSATFKSFSQGFYTPQIFSTPHGSFTTYQYHYMPYYRGKTGANSEKNDYKIILKNDSIISAFAKINIKDTIQSITIKQNRQKIKIKPSDTKEIICFSFFNPIHGIPADSCWLFKSFSGKINAYSYLPDPKTMYIIAIQKGKDGPIVGITKKLLLEMVQDNPKAVKKVENESFIEAIVIYNKN